MANWFIWGAIICVAMALSDVASELKLLRQEIAAQKSWKKYLKDDGK